MNDHDSPRTSNDLLRSLLLTRAGSVQKRLAERLTHVGEALSRDSAFDALGALGGASEELVELHTFLKLAREQYRDQG
jgi:hypothetical protein